MGNYPGMPKRTLPPAEMAVTQEAQKGFYPTPPELAEKLLSGVKWDMIDTILEPSAGKGDLVLAVANKLMVSRYGSYDRKGKGVDCIEIDPNLRSILQYEFGGQHTEEIRDRLRVLDAKQRYNYDTRARGELTPEEAAENRSLKIEEEKRDAISFHMIHDDFLTFNSRKHYDLIVMNPPFEDGDAHLLRAISLQERSGGQIRCILNAETLYNPYSNRRKLLKRRLAELGAEVKFLEGAFSHGERQTDVSVALVKITIPEPKRESTIFERLRAAAHIEDVPPSNITDMAVTEFLEQIVARFNVEVDAGLELIHEFSAMRPYIMDSFDEEDKYKNPTMTLCVGEPGRLSRGENPDINKFLKLTRRKYWSALFSNKEFIGKLTSNLQTKYREMVDALAEYDFTLFNIQQIVTQMNAEMGQGIQNTIVVLFNRMTEKHTWYPEMEKNVHYFNGWKTNKVHKINSKVILPCNGVFSSYKWSGDEFSVYQARSIISDIEKVFDYLDGQRTEPVDLQWVLDIANKTGNTKNIRCKYFDITFYKKGTMHIKFRDQALVDRFNIYCCRKKNWLPPNYGKVRYQAMSVDEQAVVDGFHGDGQRGAGRADYAKVLAKADFFLAEPTRELPALMSPVA